MRREASQGRFKILRVDLERPFPEMVLRQDEGGFAVEVFRGQQPVDFVMIGREQDAPVVLEELRKRLAATSAPGPQSPLEHRAVPDVTIAICTKDRPDLVARCLAALENLVVDPPAQSPRILVVDNASKTEKTREVCAAFPNVRFAYEKVPGLNFARNRALMEADTQLLAFIDDDAVADPMWLSGLLAAWSASPQAGAFTGQTLPLELETSAQLIVERMGGFRKGFRQVVYGRTHSTDPLYPCTTVFGNGCNMAFNTDVMRELGGFDEALDMGAYLPGGGDLDALYRVVRSGHPLVYEPRMLLRHQHRRDMRGLRRQVRRSWGAGCMAFLTKIRDHDREMSDKASRFIRWWIKDLVWRITTLRNTPEQPWLISVYELVGAIEGMMGLYDRSTRRSVRLRQAHNAR